MSAEKKHLCGVSDRVVNRRTVNIYCRMGMGKAAKKKMLRKMISNPVVRDFTDLKMLEQLLNIPDIHKSVKALNKMPSQTYSLTPDGEFLYEALVSFTISQVKMAKTETEVEMWQNFPNKCLENAVTLHLISLNQSSGKTEDCTVIPKIFLEHGIKLAKWSIDNNQWIPPTRDWAV